MYMVLQLKKQVTEFQYYLKKSLTEKLYKHIATPKSNNDDLELEQLRFLFLDISEFSIIFNTCITLKNL